MRISDWSYPKFLITGILMAATISGGFLLMNYRLDPLGVFGQNQATEIPGYCSNERFSKYMLSQRYVGKNFDTVLIGGSNSDNFPVQNTSSHGRMYNASLNSGNVLELLPIVDHVTRSGRVKTVYFCIHPYLVNTAHYKTNLRMDAVGKEAWGSVSLLKVYAGALTSATPTNNSSGVLDESVYLPPGEWWPYFETAKLKPAQSFAFLPQAANQLAVMGQLCRARGVRLVTFLHPRPTLLYDRFEKQALEGFLATASAQLGQEILDPNRDPGPELKALLDDPRTYRDTQHLTLEGAEKVWPLLFHWVVTQPSETKSSQDSPDPT